ncbi:hypothetical protein [Streptomyces montanisoli]|uniref:Uncharacterized protein n=1 Tax=Streptomyces montanisoli TaxID=2798581 RepID=A0A940RTM4_9ACTN|nr:hypothetical protein [Streptomyces montanisoli]MBP0456321.1 hypothetical protein [Streptomyces montanisoli]
MATSFPAPTARRRAAGAPLSGLLPLLGFAVLLAAVFTVAYAVGSASGPAAPGLHRTGGGGPKGGGPTGGMAGMGGM